MLVSCPSESCSSPLAFSVLSEELAGFSLRIDQKRERLHQSAWSKSSLVVDNWESIQISADLLVLSTHGYTGWKHLLFGSDAENILQHAPCPILVVR